jgi:hypothetical protein
MDLFMVCSVYVKIVGLCERPVKIEGTNNFCNDIYLLLLQQTTVFNLFLFLLFGIMRSYSMEHYNRLVIKSCYYKINCCLILIIEVDFNSNTYVKRKCKPDHK